jgi:hypothetical protein
MQVEPKRPARRRAFLCAVGWLLALAAPAGAADAPLRPAPHPLGSGQADQAEGRRALQEFRRAGIVGGYWLSFELRVMPRQGEERSVRGQLFGQRSELGPLTRLDLAGTQWLIRSGSAPATWSLPRPGAAAHELAAGESLSPVAGTDLTVFDLQMPFLYWDDFVYEGLAKIRGRPAYSFILYPPADLAAQRPELTAVRVALDTQFHALVQAELLGAKGEPWKTITVLDLKKTGEQWIVKSIDLRNHRTRDKTRFNVNATALNLDLPAAAFTPAGLAGEPPSLDGAHIEPL